MKLVVLGANGGTGQHVVAIALRMGWTVTAVVRSEAKRPAMVHDNLFVAIGDPCDQAFLAGAMRGQDAVISTLGGKLPTRKATSVSWRSAEALVKATARTGVRRVAVTSTALRFPPQRLFDKVLARLVFPVVQSAARMETALMQADLDVLIARCGFLTDADDASYCAAPDALPARGFSVSRQALAQFLIDMVQDEWSGSRVYGVAAAVVGEVRKTRPAEKLRI